jgi:hypothetical protein
MTKFEIFIPAQDPSSFNMTLKVSAETWMAALKLGLAKLQLPIAINDVVVEMQDDQSISVTEPATGRQFRITELSDAAAPVVKAAPPAAAPPSASEAAFMQAFKPAPVAQAPITPVVAAPIVPAAAPQIAFTQAPVAAAPVATQAQKQAPVAAPPSVPPKAAPPAKKPQPPAATAVKPAPVADQVINENPQPVTSPRDEAHEDRMVAAFHRVTEILAKVKSPAEAANAFLDGVLELLPAEAGAIFFANIAEKDLSVAAARGPSASYALAQRVPMGLGIIGNAVEAAMPIGSIDVTKDPRYSPEVPEALGVKPDTIASSPVQKEGRTFGVLHLVNRRAKGGFTRDELELLAYFSDRLADYLDRYLTIAA